MDDRMIQMVISASKSETMQNRKKKKQQIFIKKDKKNEKKIIITPIMISQQGRMISPYNPGCLDITSHIYHLIHRNRTPYPFIQS
jgi:hypothetical protein